MSRHSDNSCRPPISGDPHHRRRVSDLIMQQNIRTGEKSRRRGSAAAPAAKQAARSSVRPLSWIRRERERGEEGRSEQRWRHGGADRRSYPGAMPLNALASGGRERRMVAQKTRSAVKKPYLTAKKDYQPRSHSWLSCRNHSQQPDIHQTARNRALHGVSFVSRQTMRSLSMN